jgi:methylated-DNA-[protein]-cysteine S-methyltransferase
MICFTNVVDSPVGPLFLAVDEAGAVVRIELVKDRSIAGLFTEPGTRLVEDAARTAHVERQLAEYFAGQRRSFDLELAPRGTPFEQEVWAALRAIPFGETRSYGEIAAALGRPGAARAVGRANGANPIPIVVPCHRVLGSDGSLTGFGGGLEAKERLLELEGAKLPLSPPSVPP